MTYTITDGDRTKIVHVNRIRPRLQPTSMSPNTDGPPAERNREAPSMEHHIIDLDEPGSCYPVTQFELEDPLIVFIFSSRMSLHWGRRM